MICAEAGRSGVLGVYIRSRGGASGITY